MSSGGAPASGSGAAARRPLMPRTAAAPSTASAVPRTTPTSASSSSSSSSAALPRVGLGQCSTALPSTATRTALASTRPTAPTSSSASTTRLNAAVASPAGSGTSSSSDRDESPLLGATAAPFSRRAPSASSSFSSAHSSSNYPSSFPSSSSSTSSSSSSSSSPFPPGSVSGVTSFLNTRSGALCFLFVIVLLFGVAFLDWSSIRHQPTNRAVPVIQVDKYEEGKGREMRATTTTESQIQVESDVGKKGEEEQKREQERKAKEEEEKKQKEEQERREREKREREQKEREQREKEQREKEQREKEQREKEQREKEQREKEQREREQKEKEKQAEAAKQQSSSSDPTFGLPSRGRVFDVFSTLKSLPPLVSILRANNVTINDESGHKSGEVKGFNTDPYFAALADKLEPKKLRWQDPRDDSKFKRMADLPMQQLHSFISTSTWNPNYLVQSFQNLCMRFASPSGGARLNELVFIHPEGEKGVEKWWQEMAEKKNAPKRTPGWLPFRYHNDQMAMKVERQPDPNWFWVPAVLPDTKPPSDSSSLPPSTFHQLSWDFNVGHQFHQQILAMNTALTSHSRFQTPVITSLMLDFGYFTDDQSSMDRPGPWDRNQWKEINKFFARVVLEQVKERVTLLGTNWKKRNETVDGLCFERVSFNEPRDGHLDYMTLPDLDQRSVAAFRDLREATFRMIGIQSKPSLLSPNPAKPVTERPLIVTIYDRKDSSRRRITNVDAIVELLGPYHVIRYCPEFGKRPAAEQLSLFASTDILIAPHGAHMTFSFLLPLNALVIEQFAHENGKFSWIVQFLKGMGIHHEIGIGKADMSLPERKDFRDMDRDFEVKLDWLCEVLIKYKIPSACKGK